MTKKLYWFRCLNCGKIQPNTVTNHFDDWAETDHNRSDSLKTPGWLLIDGWLELYFNPDKMKSEKDVVDAEFLYVCPKCLPLLETYLSDFHHKPKSEEVIT